MATLDYLSEYSSKTNQGCYMPVWPYPCHKLVSASTANQLSKMTKSKLNTTFLPDIFVIHF